MTPYADPGSGALIWQTLVATLVGLLFYLRQLTSWLKSGTRSQRH
jgi:hypothetical protein